MTIKRQTRAMPMYRFILGMVLACYVGFSRLNQLRFLKLEPMLTGILRVAKLPPQSTFWRFLASMHLGELCAYEGSRSMMKSQVATTWVFSQCDRNVLAFYPPAAA